LEAGEEAVVFHQIEVNQCAADASLHELGRGFQQQGVDAAGQIPVHLDPHRDQPLHRWWQQNSSHVLCPSPLFESEGLVALWRAGFLFGHLALDAQSAVSLDQLQGHPQPLIFLQNVLEVHILELFLNLVLFTSL
jgi:hypothetical protein